MKIVWILALSLLIASCAKKPTHNTTVVDDRPRITFSAELAAPANNYLVIVDGIEYGDISKYLSSESALRIISGRHQVQISYKGQVIKSYELTLGANETRVLKVNHAK